MLLILIIIPFFGCIFSQNFIQEPNIIQVGEYTNLICILNYTNYLDFFKREFHGWYDINKNNNANFIVGIYKSKIYNKRNPKKFKIFTINNKIILQIKNINENDKKYNFVCYYHDDIKKKSYNNKFIKLPNLTFFNPLSLENMKIEYLNNTNSTEININFKKIFPIPKCFLKIRDKIIFFKNITTTKIDYLYSKVNLNIKIKEINCLEKIICTLFNKNFIIDYTNNICLLKYNLIYSVISVIIILISGIILTIFIYFQLKEKNII